MVRFSYHSAQVACEILASGAGSVAFYGVLTRKGFDVLRQQACLSVHEAPAIVMRLDTAVMADRDDFMDATARACPHDAVALVVPSDRYEQALALARKLATAFGVRRPVFLPEQSLMAYRWAAHVARSQFARLPLPQP